MNNSESKQFLDEANSIFESFSDNLNAWINHLLESKGGKLTTNEILAMLTALELGRIEIVNQFMCKHKKDDLGKNILLQSRQAANLIYGSGIKEEYTIN
jgi:hypothetical protein